MFMKSTNDKTNFIRLRGQGLSFESISKQLDISKPTLIQWQRELDLEIRQARYYEIEIMLEEYSVKKAHRVKSLGIMLQKVRQELEQRSFTDISTERLVELCERFESRLERELKNVSYPTGEKKDFIPSFEEDIIIPLD